ncbi:MAG: acetoin utilization protein AcuC [Phycisphaerae bacterium]|nr:acetoin utilization protein AcuC [Phycisphaerae bacterium]
MTDRKAAFIHCRELDEFKYPAESPFNTSRANRVKKILNSMGLLGGKGIRIVAPQMAEYDTLRKFHTARYLKALKAASNGELNVEALGMGIGGPDCPVFADVYNYSSWACGATITGAKLIIDGSADRVFNPSGGLHHAGPEKAAGFCYMNDVALGCMVLAEAGKRVLYLDIDVHHGDGVQNAFYGRNDVMTISFHEDGRTLFPGTGFENEIGTGEGKGYSINVPLIHGTFDEAFMHAFKEIVPPLYKAFAPDAVVFELGADTLAGDPLAHLRLTNNVYAKVIKILLDLGKPILMTGGGGYNIENTVRAWAYAWSVLIEEDSLHDMHLGLGGVMLETTDWQAGLKDRKLPVTAEQKHEVDAAVDKTIERIKKLVFPIHGLK